MAATTARSLLSAGARLQGDDAVAQHHDPVGEVEDLGEPVGDVDDGDALVAQPAHLGEQRLGLRLVEGRPSARPG